MTKQPLVETKNLKKHFSTDTGLLDRFRRGDERNVKAVDGVDLQVRHRETHGLVGESGSGKSTLGQTIFQLLRPSDGRVWFDGERIDTMTNSEIRSLRRNMQFIFQDPGASLNPRRKVYDIVRRPLDIHNIGDSRTERTRRVEELLEQVGLSKDQSDRYPHEFSGGQQQRIAIARALAVNPQFIVADEPVSSLDVVVQAQILNLLEDLKKEYNLTILFITHDLSVVRYIADRVSVMYLGNIMETGTTDEIFSNYQHPYTESLMKAIPSRSVEDRGEIKPLEGEIPTPTNPPSGCVFRTRCPLANERCVQNVPDRSFSESHQIHCVERTPKSPRSSEKAMERNQQ